MPKLNSKSPSRIIPTPINARALNGPIDKGLELFHCMRCHKDWMPRIVRDGQVVRPRQCAGCGSAYWDKPNTKHITPRKRMQARACVKCRSFYGFAQKQGMPARPKPLIPKPPKPSVQRPPQRQLRERKGYEVIE